MQSRLRRTRVRLTLLFVVGFTAVAAGAAPALFLLFSSLGYHAAALEHAIGHVQLLFALVVGALVLGSAILGYWLTGRALHSVRVMAALARDITEHDLHRRISLPLPPGDELGELAETFNAMLERLQNAFEALQRFTADAAHELRAPLTLMRTQVDVTLRRERTGEAYRSSHEALRAEIERLSRVADQLLLLARSDSGALVARPREVDLAQLVEDVVERWREVAAQRGLELDGELPMDGS